MQMTFLLTIAIYQARKVYIALLVAKKIKILKKHSDFLDAFLEKKALV